MKTILENVREIAKPFEKDEEFYWNCIVEDEDEEEYTELWLETEVENFLKELKGSGKIIDYNIQSEQLFSSPGYDCGYIAVSWIEEDYTLQLVVFNWDYD